MKKDLIKEPLVAIGVPVYNGEKYLAECLDSIQKQTYSNWVCVITNNKSTDSTADIAGEYAKRDERFKLYNAEEFLSMIDNWNFSYSKSPEDAEYFKIIPADDWIYPDFLAEMVPLMETNKQAGVCSSYRVDETQVRAEGLSPYEGNIFDGKKIIAGELLYDILDVTGSVNTVLYRNSNLKKIPEYPNIHSKDNLHCDTDLTYKILFNSDFCFIFKILSYTRQHNETVTSFALRINTFLNAREKLVFTYKHLNTRLEKTYKEVRKEYAKETLKNILKRNTDYLQWHKENLPRWFTIKEYLRALF